MATPLALPRRLAASIGNSIDAAGELPVFQQKVLEHLASMDQVMSEHLSSMDGNTAALIELIGPMREDMAVLAARSAELERATVRMEALLEGIAERVPDPDAPGPLAKARDAITGDQ